MSKSNNKRALKSGLWYTAGNFLLKGIGLITTPLFSRLMTQEDIGDFSNLITWVGITSIIVTLDLYSSIAVARFDYKEDLNSYISSVLCLGSFITIIFFAVSFPFHNIIMEYIGFSEYVYYLIFAYMLFFPSIQIFQAKSQAMYQYKASFLISLLTAIFSSFLSLIFVAFSTKKLDGRVIGYFIPFIVVGMIIFLFYIMKYKPRTKYWKYALAISTPLIFHLLAGYVLNSSDKIMIHSICGSREVGLYSVAYSCAMIINVLMSSMNLAWVPWSMDQIAENNIHDLQKKAKLFISIFGILVFLIVLMGPEVLLIMGGNSYMEAKYVIPPVMIGIVFQFIYTLYVNIEQYYKKQKQIAAGTLIAAIVNVVLNWIFIPYLGYVAAAYTTLVSYAVLFLIHFLFVKHMKKNQIYDSKFNLIFLFSAVVFMLFSILLYEMNFLRYTLLSIFFIIVFVYVIRYRRIIIKSIKSESILPVLSVIDVFIR